MKVSPSTQQAYTDKDISKFHWTNGLPPTPDESPEWTKFRKNDWKGYEITLADDINGVEKVVTIEQLRELPQQSYVATHTCMQGWSATSRWAGPSIEDVLSLLGPRPEGANYVMVESYGLAQKMYDNRPREPFYACFSIDDALDAQSVIALSRNGHEVDIHLGAPARCRVESNHGYKAVKWVSRLAGSLTTQTTATAAAVPARILRCRRSTAVSKFGNLTAKVVQFDSCRLLFPLTTTSAA